MKRSRDADLLEEEDREIKKYAKLLGYSKRQSKNQPKVFEAEGLDGTWLLILSSHLFNIVRQSLVLVTY